MEARMRFFSGLVLAFLLIAATRGQAQTCVNSSLDTTWDQQAYFSVILNLREPGSDDSQCGDVIESQLQLLAAIQWTVQELNDNNYIPGVTIGYQVYDDCGSEQLALEGVHSWYGCDRSTVDNQCRARQEQPNIGLIALSHAMANKATLELLHEYAIPVVSPFLPGLSETTYNNFHQTRPSLEKQTKVLVDLIQSLGWTYTVAIHTDDEYGTAGVRQLVTTANDAGICVTVLGSIPRRVAGTDVSLDRMVTRLIEAREESRADNLGVIFSGTSQAGRMLLEKISQSVSRDQFTWFLLDAMENAIGEMFVTNTLPDNTVMVRPANPVIGSFEQFYSEQIEKAQLPPDAQSNPLEVMMNQFYTENNQLPQNITSDTRNFNVFSVIDAVVTLVTTYRMAVDSRRGHDTKDITYFLSQVDAIYSSIPFFSALPSMKVGNNSENRISIFMSNATGQPTKIRTFDETDTRLVDALSALPKCHCNGVCDDCHTSEPYRYAYIDGDPLILGLFAVHGTDAIDSFSCGDFKHFSVQSMLPEAFLYGIDVIRKRTGINFGALILDTCQSASRVTLVVSRFFSGDIKLTKPGSSEVIDPGKVRLAVGAYFSGTTIPLAMLLTGLSIPLVSYSASSPDLDDRLNFPFFLRTVPSDVVQSHALAQVIKRMDWQYVSLLYIDNNYGRKGKEAFEEQAEKAGLCILDSPIPLKETDEVNDNYDVMAVLRFQKPEVIVLFGIEGRIASLVKFLNEQCTRTGVCDKFIFLASEDWGSSIHILDSGGDMTLGSISLKLESSKAADKSFGAHLLQRTPYSGVYNPWFNIAWMDMHSCSLGAAYDASYPKPCRDDMKFDPGKAQEWAENQRTIHLLNAMIAIGQGMTSANTLLCPDQEGFGCGNFRNHPESVTKSVKEAKLFSDGIEFRMFDDNGNGNTGFDIMQIRRLAEDSRSLKYEHVGKYEQGKLSLSPDDIKYYRGEVVAACTPEICSHCNQLQNVQTTAMPDSMMSEIRPVDIAIVVVVVIICLLLIGRVILDFRIMKRGTRRHATDDVPLTVVPCYASSPVGRRHEPRYTDSDNLQGFQRSDEFDSQVYLRPKPSLPLSRENDSHIYATSSPD